MTCRATPSPEPPRPFLAQRRNAALASLGSFSPASPSSAAFLLWRSHAFALMIAADRTYIVGDLRVDVAPSRTAAGERVIAREGELERRAEATIEAAGDTALPHDGAADGLGPLPPGVVAGHIHDLAEGAHAGGARRRGRCDGRTLSAESREQILESAKMVAAAGARSRAAAPTSLAARLQLPGNGPARSELLREVADETGLLGTLRGDGDFPYRAHDSLHRPIPSGRAQHAELQPAASWGTRARPCC